MATFDHSIIITKVTPFCVDIIVDMYRRTDLGVALQVVWQRLAQLLALLIVVCDQRKWVDEVVPQVQLSQSVICNEVD